MERKCQVAYINKQIYILSSDEEIKLHDWYIDDTSQIRQNLIEDKDYWDVREDYKKIIAATDTSLKTVLTDHTIGSVTYSAYETNLPQPSEAFIRAYVESHNYGNPITEVMVEYNRVFKGYHEKYGGEIWEEVLKVDSNHNTITIRKVKDSYTREEVIKLLDKYDNDFAGSDTTLRKYNKSNWIKKNL